MENIGLDFELLRNGKIVGIDGLEEESEEVLLSIETNHNNKKHISKIKFYHQQDCCESVSLYEYHGNIEIGDTLVDLKINSEDGNNEWGSSTWTFITIETFTNTLTLRFLGESNGYYSEEVNIDFIDLPEGIIKVNGVTYASLDGIVKKALEVREMFGITVVTLQDNWNGNKFNSYVVSNGEYSAHGRTVESALSDLKYKYKKVDLSNFEEYTLDTYLTFDEAVILYRKVTGACNEGTLDFLRKNYDRLDRNKLYTIREIIRITENQYGNLRLKEYFNV